MTSPLQIHSRILAFFGVCVLNILLSGLCINILFLACVDSNLILLYCYYYVLISVVTVRVNRAKNRKRTDGLLTIM